MAKYVVVAESGSDITPEVADRYGIRIAPMHVSFGGGTFDDGSFPVSDVFRHFERTGELPRTSGCTPQDFIPLFDEIHEQQPEAHILYLAYSAITTCSYESALLAARERDYVTAIDTKCVSSGQGLVVTNVARFLESNPDSSLDEVRAFIDEQVKRARMSFIPGGLQFLRAGGRLSNGAYLGAQLLRIKPVIEIIDGKLVATKKLRGSMERAVMEMLEAFLGGTPICKERALLIRNEGLSEDLQRQVEQRLVGAGFKVLEWVDTGCVIASHCGPGSFGIAALAEA